MKVLQFIFTSLLDFVSSVLKSKCHLETDQRTYIQIFTQKRHKNQRCVKILLPVQKCRKNSNIFSLKVNIVKRDILRDFQSKLSNFLKRKSFWNGLQYEKKFFMQRIRWWWHGMFSYSGTSLQQRKSDFPAQIFLHKLEM